MRVKDIKNGGIIMVNLNDVSIALQNGEAEKVSEFVAQALNEKIGRAHV